MAFSRHAPASSRKMSCFFCRTGFAESNICMRLKLRARRALLTLLRTKQRRDSVSDLIFLGATFLEALLLFRRGLLCHVLKKNPMTSSLVTLVPISPASPNAKITAYARGRGFGDGCVLVPACLTRFGFARQTATDPFRCSCTAWT